MRLPDEMRRLTDHLRQAYESRVEAVAAARNAAAAIRYEAVQDLRRVHTARREMAAELKRHLADAAAARRGAERSRRAGAAEAARQRAEYVDSLRVSVASTRASIASRLNELRGDMSEAHRVWAEFGGLIGQARPRAPVAPPAPPAPPGVERMPSRRRRLFRKG
jgi:hypothetical protein